MTHERRPLAVLMSALADQAAAILEGPSNGEGPENQEWWQPKKRKRAVACGRCSSCCRDDCGRCLNCLDKPKFGGNGIRKQSCLERKCQQAGSGSTMPPPNSASSALPSLPSSQEVEHTQEWDAFWSAVECCASLQASSRGYEALNSLACDDRASRRARNARCGTCTSCVRGDCGECKNCLDKPKFGGRGIKKKACLRRACCISQPEADSDSEPSQSTVELGSSVASPALHPMDGSTSPLHLDAAQSSHETLPRLESLASSTSAVRATRLNQDGLLSMGYSTADEEQLHSDSARVNSLQAVSKTVEPLDIAHALVLACERS
mmetsp:Transcript_6582/g.13694  ORF Transcript_6582/g.13694 Transcript_6582/m.13694 type:complete len:321 (+) Transcript_6582:173-1135(+)|eukprot:CAMPEP_0182830296 /NCGR_PEP_ID=MMETSP0006_2-20121128/18496_1 /TAXON_ID=97485 /ORGANISM="Prymnesium parvum, Strain Texoma1" /LENGTH=320 /DNA_ID=CAMNT_0024957847 /DNA_START=131 /DNA_END=1093 /DNA_ORIENTATION=-